MATSTAPFGSWRSPLTAELIAAGSIKLKDVFLDGTDLYWLELRPAEGGRSVVVRGRSGGTPEVVTPAGFDVRSRVHEYGGGACTIHRGRVYFVNNQDQRIYAQAPGEAPVPLTPEGRWRYADLVVDEPRHRLIAVAEEHAGGPEPVNRLVEVALAGGAPKILVEGHDFYATPRLSPDGTKLAWLAWRHPLMPWDGTELWTGRFDEHGGLREAEMIAGGTKESIFQPEWSPEGVLHFVSDRTGWWNLYRFAHAHTEPLFPAEAEFGLPHWIFGETTYGFPRGPGLDGKLLCTWCETGQWRLGLLDPAQRTLVPVATPFTDFECLRVDGDRAAFLGGAPTEPRAVVTLALRSGRPTVSVHKRSFDIPLPAEAISVAEPLAFPTTDGLVSYAFYYPPRNPSFTGPAGARPPLLVICHGGPTGSTSTSLQLEIQFWTSRGFGVVDVNYGGSTGYGREYRERLRGRWGIVDVDDCINAAKFLVERGSVDREQSAIRGGSAGGYTTLAALSFHDYFRAGANYYGVSDLEALIKDTHKFESKYDRFLVGPYPQAAALYRERSPIHHLDGFRRPLLVLQGLEDKVVPPNQSELIVEALRKKKVPVAYLAFEGEQHGFRRSENIRRSLEAELYFYGRVFGFEPADRIEPIAIENLR